MKIPSIMVPLGTRAPDFTLPDVVSDKSITLNTYKHAKALLVVFLCRHCPYVQHVKHELVKLSRDYKEKGLSMVGISSNDPAAHPEDAPESLAEFAKELGFPFPICFDETQEVARAYDAACTPDFFLYDAKWHLAYRGQLDDSRPGMGTATGADLRAAIDAVLAGKPAQANQKPSTGCSIKWKT